MVLQVTSTLKKLNFPGTNNEDLDSFHAEVKNIFQQAQLHPIQAGALFRFAPAGDALEILKRLFQARPSIVVEDMNGLGPEWRKAL